MEQGGQSMKRQMIFKKAIALVLTFSMAFSIAACGDGRAEEVKEQGVAQQGTGEKEADQGTGDRKSVV